MAEQPSGALAESTPVSTTNPAKLTHQWLEANPLTKADVKDQIGADILQNAQALNPDIPWGAVLQIVSWARPGIARRPFTGRLAITIAVAQGIGSAAREMGWNMDSPQVVYMGSSAISSLISRRLSSIAETETNIQTGVHRFPTEELKQQRLSELTEESGKLGVCVQRIQSALEQYSKENIPEAENPAYLEALKAFPFMSYGSKILNRDKAYTDFKKGEYQSAVAHLRDTGKTLYGSNKLVWEK